MLRQRQIVTPQTRARIMVEMAQRLEWSGSRAGVKMSLTYLQRPSLSARAVEWAAYIRGQWFRGQAESVWNAIQAIEIEAGRE